MAGAKSATPKQTLTPRWESSGIAESKARCSEPDDIYPLKAHQYPVINVAISVGRARRTIASGPLLRPSTAVTDVDLGTLNAAQILIVSGTHDFVL